MIGNPPGACTQGDLETRMEIEEDNGCDEEVDGKGVVSGCLVGFVEGVGFCEFGLVVEESCVLLFCQDGEFFAAGFLHFAAGF